MSFNLLLSYVIFNCVGPYNSLASRSGDRNHNGGIYSYSVGCGNRSGAGSGY